MTDDFDPASIADIEARFERIEQEEAITICLYAELPYEAATSLVKWRNDWQDGSDFEAFFHLIQFLDGLIESLEITLDATGLPPEED